MEQEKIEALIFFAPPVSEEIIQVIYDALRAEHVAVCDEKLTAYLWQHRNDKPDSRKIRVVGGGEA